MSKRWNFFLQKKKYFILILAFTIHHLPLTYAQQPAMPTTVQQHQIQVYMLSITPKNGGKSFSLYQKTKLQLTLGNQVVKGKLRGVSKDSIAIDEGSYAVKDIDEITYNPGTALGVAAAIATAVGVGMIAFTADGGKDKERDDTENAIFYSGIGLAVAGGVALIPTYFIKKHFTREKYDFITVQAAY